MVPVGFEGMPAKFLYIVFPCALNILQRQLETTLCFKVNSLGFPTIVQTLYCMAAGSVINITSPGSSNNPASSTSPPLAPLVICIRETTTSRPWLA